MNRKEFLKILGGGLATTLISNNIFANDKNEIKEQKSMQKS